MKKLYVDGMEMDAITDAVDEILDNMDEYEFEEHITDEFGSYTYIEPCDGEWETIELLRKLDVYDDMFDAWKEEKRDEIEREIEEMCVGDSKELYGCEVEVKDDIVELFANARKALKEITTALDSLRPIYGGSQANNLNLLIEFIDAVEEKVKTDEE